MLHSESLKHNNNFVSNETTKAFGHNNAMDDELEF